MQNGGSLGAKEHLLLVDGDAESLRVLEVSLTNVGFVVTTARGCASALEKVERSRPDLIISEVDMEDGDGFALLVSLREKPEWAAIPFVFLTTRSSTDTKMRALDLEVQDYLTKPMFMDEILSRVQLSLLKHQQSNKQVHTGRMQFCGSLQEMGIVDLIQTVEMGRKSAIIRCQRGSQCGSIYIRDGKIIDADCGALSGNAAVYKLITWEQGTFEVQFRSLRRNVAIVDSTQTLLMEGLKRHDEWNRLSSQLSLEEKYDIDTEEFSRRLSTLPDQMNCLLKHVNGERTVGEIIELCPLDELECLRSVVSFVDCGLLVVAAEPVLLDRESRRQHMGKTISTVAYAPVPTNGNPPQTVQASGKQKRQTRETLRNIVPPVYPAVPYQGKQDSTAPSCPSPSSAAEQDASVPTPYVDEVVVDRAISSNGAAMASTSGTVEVFTESDTHQNISSGGAGHSTELSTDVRSGEKGLSTETTELTTDVPASEIPRPSQGGEQTMSQSHCLDGSSGVPVMYVEPSELSPNGLSQPELGLSPADEPFAGEKHSDDEEAVVVSSAHVDSLPGASHAVPSPLSSSGDVSTSIVHGSEASRRQRTVLFISVGCVATIAAIVLLSQYPKKPRGSVSPSIAESATPSPDAAFEGAEMPDEPEHLSPQQIPSASGVLEDHTPVQLEDHTVAQQESSASSPPPKPTQSVPNRSRTRSYASTLSAKKNKSSYRSARRARKRAKSIKGSNPKRALKLLEQSLAIHPSSRAYAMKADILMDLGNNQSAMQAANAAVRVGPSNPVAWLTKGLLHYQLRQYSPARVALQKYLDLRPNGVRAPAVRSMLEDMHP